MLTRNQLFDMGLWPTRKFKLGSSDLMNHKDWVFPSYVYHDVFRQLPLQIQIHYAVYPNEKGMHWLTSIKPLVFASFAG